MRHVRRAWRGAVGALCLLLLLAAEAGGAERRGDQECFCTGLWTCFSRMGLPYSECDRAGQRVICCVRRSQQQQPAGPTAFSSTTSSTPPSPTEAEDRGRDADQDQDLEPGADTHFRYSTGRQLATTAGPPLLGASRGDLTPRPFSTVTPPTTAFDDVDDDEEDGEGNNDDDDDDDQEDDDSLLGSTPRPPSTASRTTPRPAVSSPRPFSVFVTPAPALATAPVPHVPRRQDGGSQHQARAREWEEGEGRGAHQQRPQQPQREPKKIDWLSLARPTAARTPLHSKQGVVPSPNIAEVWSSWQDCGVKGIDSGLDGTAEPSEWPWHAALLETASDRYVCGATLIGPTWLLTAAHCVVEYPDPTALKVRVGELDVRSDSESFTQERAVVQLLAHPDFELASLRHDIAMVRIARPPRDHRNVGAVCLPPTPPRSARQDDPESNDSPREGTVCVVTGWGRKDEMSPHSEVLKEVPVPVWSRDPCQAALRAHLGPSFQLPKTAICAGAKGRDACDGDGGGPLVCKSGGHWFQMGIVSYGIGCGRNHSPGVYTKVSSYAAWVRSVVAGQRSPDTSAGRALQAQPSPARPPPPQQANPRANLVLQRVGQAGPAVSRVRVNHYTGSVSSTTTPSPPTASPRAPARNVVVLSSEQEDASRSSEEDEDEDAVTEIETLNGTTTTSAPLPPSSTFRPTTSESIATSTPRSPRVLGHAGTYGGVPSAGVSYFRSNFGSSGWSYPLEGHKAAATATSTQTVAPAPASTPGDQPAHKWYSTAYSGSYRGTAGGPRLPAQTLSNVAGRTTGGLHRWYSPFYTGSYRGHYNAYPKDELDAKESMSANTVFAVAPSAPSSSTSPVPPKARAPPTAFDVRPPLAALRWYAPPHDQAQQRWFSSFHNGTYRSGYVGGQGTAAPAPTPAPAPKHRFATDTADGADAQDKLWTYRVQTGTKGTSITLDMKHRAEAVATAHHPFVSDSWGDGARQGRTLVNYTNTFTYPSAPHRNASRPAPPRPAPSSLSSSYSIYHIYPSVSNPEYAGRSGKQGRESKATEVTGSAKTTLALSPVPTAAAALAPSPLPAAPSPAPSPAPPPAASVAPALADSTHKSIVGYMHFNSRDAAVHFNITHDDDRALASEMTPAPRPSPSSIEPAPVRENVVDVAPDSVPVVTTISALDLTTLRAATAEDSTTGGDGMDMPPVAIVSTTEADTGAPTASTTSNTPTESATTISTDATTELDAATTSRGRGRSSFHHEDSTEGARVTSISSMTSVSRVNVLARSSALGGQNGLTFPRSEPEQPAAAGDAERGRSTPVPAGAELGAEAGPTPAGLDALWGDRTAGVAGVPRRGRTQQVARGGRRLETPLEAEGVSAAPTPRPRSRGRSRSQPSAEAGSPARATPSPSPPTQVAPRASKDRTVFYSSQSQRHSKVADETASVRNPEPDPARAFRARGRRPQAHSQASTAALSPTSTPSAPLDDRAGGFVAGVRPARNRGRDHRRRPSSTVSSMVLGTDSSTAPDAEMQELFGPGSTAAPVRQPHPHQPPQQQQQQRSSKKPRKQLKKVSLASAEEPVETVFVPVSPSPAHAPRHHKHATWFPADVAAAEAEAGRAHVDDRSGELHRGDDEDLERDDVYVFLSQRNKRRRAPRRGGGQQASAERDEHPAQA